MLTLRDLSFRLGSTVLLDHANLVVEKGERVAVLGRNGMGKSTMLRIIDGTLGADEGEIVRAQGLSIARLVQDVPQDLTGTAFDIVATGLGPLGDALMRFQHLVMEHPERLKEIGALQSQLDSGGGWALDSKVREVLSRVDIPEDALFESLSGGLRRRVLLARALAADPDLLLLDEPTNHLDVASIEWLENFLANFSGAILFVTHDRAFLRRLATRIVELDRGWLTDWPGDYDNFLRRREERSHAESQERALFDKKLAQEEAWIRQGIEARRTRNEGRVTRLLAMRDQFQARRNAPGKATLEIVEAERSGKLVCEAKRIDFSYEGEPLIRSFSTTVLRGDRVGLVGRNGAGKTTLIRLLIGDLQPAAGEVRLGTNLQVAWFDQLRGGLDEDQPVFEALGGGKDFVEVGGRRQHVMGYLQDFLFTPDRARSPVRSLSGGERSRLLLARLFARPSNLLVLDEPTNDLDLETLELLEERLLEYSGTVLLVSHDREFLDSVVTRCIAFEEGGRIAEYVGGYSDWVRQRPPPAPAVPKASAPKPPPAPKPVAAGLNAKQRRELEELPAKIEKLEAEQAVLTEKLNAKYDRELQEKLSAMAETLATAYARWEELELAKSG